MPGNERTLLTQAQMAAGVHTLARSILTANPGLETIALVGIFTRGVPLARRIAAEIETLGGIKVLLGTIDITQYRDDLNTLQRVPKLEGSDIAFDIDDLNVVLCDEVIYTGRSVRAALDELLNFGRPKRVQLAVLVDRCGREFPVQPDFSALKVTLAPGERVAVRFTEVDGEDACTVQTQASTR
ncbi:bifunctional pyr operon transcriptional regulator/uracil phosphoribosyltransferase PyrR [Prosthecobacter sp.]|uniref:bifunctional pyr operon transcriptional regulator/uracil phosphoribosyltransferase PyrR n=1 Tax=Prosthecobacter sp. TaxID=1965333 RepID=UPI002487DA1B|nr:bifunctional pyr operon transcriptional regulator/uracil phosphoribosyltransferase PyrR [Prosthecobacter sp.]MDI1314607.1 bifunctional pyr operon transcriptional regulator/uracil phosphoribosyltransferase PyrR [Prosthecobacter sp.]